VYAHRRLGSAGLPLALVIAGHHTGLRNRAAWDGGPDARLARTQALLDEVKLEPLPGNLIAVPRLSPPPFLQEASQDIRPLRIEFWIRMLFSALVDADFLDTEAFYSEARRDARGAFPPLSELAGLLHRHLDALTAGASPSPVNKVRREVLERCRAAAALQPGVFSLTVPTGGGKTFAALAFALEHARQNGLRRVVVSAPFLTILDQTVAAYASALGDGEERPFVEHHSGIEPQRETARNRLATENWDAPLVVTTQVQLLESLFARRTSHCRKLHNLARAAIVLDEVQTLPAEYRTPVLDVLHTLVDDYGASLVLCTATQPELSERRTPDGKWVKGFPQITEIAGDAETVRRHFATLRRVQVERVATRDWDDIATRVSSEPRVLAITHLRRDARELAHRVQALRPAEPLFHLSALMCPRHRQDVLRAIRLGLEDDGPLRVVSTQLVEAGVDLDFPVVFRAMAGFDALIQSAGRCNREGRLTSGRLVVFDAPTRPPPGWLRTGADLAAAQFQDDPNLDLFDPEAYRRFDARRIAAQPTDKHGIQNARRELAFEDVAERFRLIDDGGRVAVIVPWGEAPALLSEAATTTDPGHLRRLARRLQGYSVEIPRRQAEAWLGAGVLHTVHDLFLALTVPYEHLHDRVLGLDAFDAAPAADPAALIG
jgi:CRISPR-associated endonuclease/helicase Cas3